MIQTNRAAIGELINVKERPETTLSLVRAVENPIKTVSTYVFTESIRNYFSTILESVASGRGQGFWIPAEWGAGKTHFLAALTALLSDNTEELWSNVQDSEIANYYHRLQNSRLFPVILSLRGEGKVGREEGRSLLQIIEKGIEEALEKKEMRDEVTVTSAEEIYAWFSELPPSLKDTISSYVKDQVGLAPKEYAKETGREAFTQLVKQFCSKNNISPNLTASTKERLSYVYRQLTENTVSVKYDGLLFVIDEFGFWQSIHPEGSPEYAHDEEVLETLASLLPKELGFRIYTIIASQQPVPAKLRGGALSDRFINLPLLGGGSEKDYDVIASKRVRDIIVDRIPELNQYYEYYFHNFQFMRGIGEDMFRTIFPFQPRCFEVLRRITARQLPTTRIGINVLHELIDPSSPHNKDLEDENNILKKNELVTVADLLLSYDFEEGLSEASDYRDAYKAYTTAIGSLSTLDLEEAEQGLAQRIIKTLFLWDLAYIDSPRSISLQELTQATLTSEDILKPEDEVTITLSKLSDLPQIEFSKDKGASFIVQVTGQSPVQIFNEIKQGITDPFRIQREWQRSLQLSGEEAMGELTLFPDFPLNQPKSIRVENRKIEYIGEAIIADAWRPEFGEPVRKEDRHFRLVILTQKADIEISALEDERIAVCVPAELSEEAREATKDYLAIQEMQTVYQNKPGPEAEQIRSWVKNKKPDLMRKLIRNQPKRYQAGKIYTKSELAIDACEIFSNPNNDRRFDALTGALLGSTYTDLGVNSGEFKKTFYPPDAGKVFSGLFQPNASGAAKSACENFAAGLGLSKLDNPRKFAPMPPQPFNCLNQKLEENEGHLDVWRIYEGLSNIHGLPFSMITLYVLCFVHYGSPMVDLYLKPNHPLVLRSGSKPPQNRLTQALIPEIEWKAGMEKHFDKLTVSAGPVWNDVVRFARVVKQELHDTIDPTEVKFQEQVFLEALSSLEDTVNRVTRDMKLLLNRLGESPDKQEWDAVSRISEVTQARDFAQFYQRVQEKYTEPGPFKQDLSICYRWGELSRAASEILNTKDYFDVLYLRNIDEQLKLDLMSFKEQLRLGSLIKNPSAWPSLKKNFDEFKRKYRNIYQIHHRDYYKKIGELRRQLEEQKPNLEVLSKLNTVTELGEPYGLDIFHCYQNLIQNLTLCPVTEVARVSVESQPTCNECKLPLTQEAPLEEVQRLSKDLENALKEQLRRLNSEMVKRILACSNDDKATRLLQVIQASDIFSLVNVMDDELIEFIKALFLESSVQTVAQPVLSNLAERYPALEEDKVEEAVAHFRQLLQQAFETAKKENPDKKIIRISLRGTI